MNRCERLYKYSRPEVELTQRWYRILRVHSASFVPGVSSAFTRYVHSMKIRRIILQTLSGLWDAMRYCCCCSSTPVLASVLYHKKVRCNADTLAVVLISETPDRSNHEPHPVHHRCTVPLFAADDYRRVSCGCNRAGFRDVD